MGRGSIEKRLILYDIRVIGLVLRPKNHIITSLILMILLYMFNYIQPPFESKFIFGVLMGVGLDFDHFFWAIIYDRTEISKLLSPFSINKVWNYLINGSLFVKMGSTKRERVFTYYTLHIFSAITLTLLFYIMLPQFYTVIIYTLLLHLIMDFLFNILVNEG